MKELSYVEKAKLPYSLLLDAQTNQAAAYTNNHQTITNDASEALIIYFAPSMYRRLQSQRHRRGAQSCVGALVTRPGLN